MSPCFVVFAEEWRERGGLRGDSVKRCEVRYPRSGWDGKMGDTVGHRGCMCGH